MKYRLCIKQMTIPDLDKNWLPRVINDEMFTDQKVQVIWDENGKPWLKDRPGYFISASDSDGYIAVAVSAKPIGVDIERRKARIPELLIATTDKTERSRLKIHGTNALLAAWTAKESAQKADIKIHEINTYKIFVGKKDPMTFIIRRAGIEWRGLWKFEDDYICSLAIQK